MRVIAIANQKGGAGKTSAAVNLAVCLADTGRRVLLIDLDAQCSASRWLHAESAGVGSYDVIRSNGSKESIGSIASSTGIDRLDVVPASRELAAADVQLAGEVGAQSLLRERVSDMPTDQWDYLLIDCPPSLGLLTVNALTAAREVIVPVADSMSLDGLVDLHRTVNLVQKRLNDELRISGVVLTRTRRTKLAQTVEANLRERFGELVYRTVIPETTRMQEAARLQEPITRYDRRNPAALAYTELAREVIGQEARR